MSLFLIWKDLFVTPRNVSLMDGGVPVLPERISGRILVIRPILVIREIGITPPAKEEKHDMWPDKSRRNFARNCVRFRSGSTWDNLTMANRKS